MSMFKCHLCSIFEINYVMLLCVLEISVCEKVPEKIKGRERKTWFQPVVLPSNMWSALPWSLWSRAFWCAVCPGTDCPHPNNQEARKNIKSTQWIFSYGLLDRVQFTFILASSEHFQEKGIYSHFNVWRGPFKDSKCPPNHGSSWPFSVGWNEGLGSHIGLCWCRSGSEE